MRRALILLVVAHAGCALPDSKSIVGGDHDAAVLLIDADPEAIDADPLAIDAEAIDADPLAIDAEPLDAEPLDAEPDSPPIGNFEPLVSSTSLPANYIIGRRFTIPAGPSRVITDAGLYLPTGVTGGTVKFAVYHDNALAQSAPTDSIAASADVTLDGGQRPQGALGVTLAPGNYWMFAATSVGITIGYANSNDVWGCTQMRTYATALPPSFAPAPSTSATSDAANLYLLVQ